MELTLNAGEVKIAPTSRFETEVVLEDVAQDQVLDHFTIAEVIEHFGQHELLDAISRDDVLEHFGIEEAE